MFTDYNMVARAIKRLIAPWGQIILLEGHIECHVALGPYRGIYGPVLEQSDWTISV